MLLASTFFAIPFPVIDPVLVEVGPIAIRWYSLSYIVGILLGWWYIAKLNSQLIPALSKKAYDDILVWIILGIILGGRLGYVLFYNADYYLSNPGEILAIWRGGMSFHGGFIGVLLALWLFCKSYNVPFLKITDLVACASPIGLLLGRIANFINGELYGRITNASWAVVFPNDPYPRHPSQLYQAAMEGLLLFAILLFFTFRTKAPQQTGMLSGIFLIGYGTFRIIGELFREPDPQLGFIISNITMGQLLSIPMVLCGVYLIKRAKAAVAS